MAEPLKNHFDERVPRTIAEQLASVWPDFQPEAFVAHVLEGYEPLSLMERGRHIARSLRRFLPRDFPAAVDILVSSVGERPRRTTGDGGMASFLYLPHVNFVAEFGLDHFDVSMEALYVLTQRFTAEFSIRPFIERHEHASLDRLSKWAADPNPYVRRLVSEGTRPRLPWAARLRRFQEDPMPVIALLERLKDDPEEMVRRSVANNLNDIGKDHPALLVEIAGTWMLDASEERKALVRHALRSLVKKGHPEALAVLGYGDEAVVAIENVRFTPEAVTMGEKVKVEFEVRGQKKRTQLVLVDLRIHFVRANGAGSPKVFKLRTMELAHNETMRCRKTISFADLTTRRHYAGEHLVEILVNGRAEPIGSFHVSE
jgi:3-methyladenine DNA glycosylase AlkC